jgi:protein-disulfide isomerase
MSDLNFEENEVETSKNTNSGGSDRSSLVLPASILIAALLISGAVFYSSRVNKDNLVGNVAQRVAQQPPTGGKIDVSADDDAVLGDKDAPVTIIEFSDYECPFCSRFWSDTLPQLKREYIDTGKVKLVYRDFPLSIHPNAQIAAEAAECAGEQGKYWEMHDQIFENQGQLGEGALKQWALGLGLDSGKFNSCLDSGKFTSEVQKDLADGSAVGASGTPTFFINGRKIVGAQPFSAFKAIIDSELDL